MKFLKKLPSWLKGGTYALIILIIYGLFLGLINFFAGGVTDLANRSGRIIFGAPLKFVQQFPILSDDDIAGVFFVWLFGIILYFIIGAVIGWVYGKIKK